MLYMILRNMDWFPKGLNQAESRALIAALVSFFLVLFAGPSVIRWLVRMKIGDAGLSDAAQLATHAASKAKTPTMGGVMIAGAITLCMLLFADLGKFYVQVSFIVMVFYGGLGLADDWLKLTASRRGTGRQGLYGWEKLVFQIGIAALIGYFLAGQDAGGVERALNLPMQRTYVPGSSNLILEKGVIILPTALFVLLTTLMITGMSNAVNITDGMDGLAGGVSGVVSIGLLVVCLIAGKQSWAGELLVPHLPYSGELAVLAGAMAGSCVGFLWWNCYPASVFMGDTGALCLGGLIGYVAVVIRQEYLVLIMSGMFVVEAGSVMIQVGYFKATGGRRVFKCAPFHHHLHMSNWTEQQVVVRFWLITILLTAVAIMSIKVR